MTQELTDEEKLTRNEMYIKDPAVRQALFKQFAPTFCYHKEEGSFPLHPDDFVQNVIEAKYDEYTNIQARQKRELNEIEQKELKVIQKYFWKDGKFNPNYNIHENEQDFQDMVKLPKGKSKFLVFDEKAYGYKVGEKIDIVGVAPYRHPKYDPQKKPPPFSASIIPTKEGFYIQYESVYSLNNAIKGTRWLRDLLPASIAKKADNFGLHYGDCEGMGLYINVDDKGQASIKSMQTFAHGRDGAREVAAKDCTFEKGQPCVYVGLGGHPSYADNFVGRNRFMDVVGDAYKITPDKFIDASPDKVAQKSPDIPASLSTFPRLSDSNPMIHSTSCYAKNEQELGEQSKEWHRYNPVLFITKAWNKIKSSVKNLLGYKEEKQPPKSFDIRECAENSTKSAGHGVIKEKGVEKTVSQDATITTASPKTSWKKEVGTKDTRRVQFAEGTKER